MHSSTLGPGRETDLEIETGDQTQRHDEDSGNERARDTERREGGTRDTWQGGEQKREKRHNNKAKTQRSQERGTQEQ